MGSYMASEKLCENHAGVALPDVKPAYKKRPELTKLFLFAITAVNIFFVIIVIMSLFVKAPMADISAVIHSQNTYLAAKISLLSIMCSMVIIILTGIPVAYLLAKGKGWLYTLADTITCIPLVIPPAIVGLALLMTFGRRGTLGAILADANISLAFTFAAIMLVHMFTCGPLFIQTLKNGFKSVDKDIDEAARVCGAGEKELIMHIYLPLSIKSLLTGLTISTLRAAGEFGATIMFAGNLTGKTQTLSTAIYTLAQQSTTQAVTLSVILIMFFVIPLFVFKIAVKE